MTVYSGPVFDMAVNQFGVIANHLEIPMDERDRLLLPKRAITVSCPIHRDDGSIAVFEGYRVQHHLTLGPTKGGTRFSPSVDIGEIAALAIWMSWKCALVGLPYGGAKGGVNVDLSTISKRELEGLSRRYMQEMIPFVGPHTDVMAPDMGTNEQVMAWFMDTYSMYQGQTVTEIVTGKPVASGGTLGRREATGRGVAYLANRVMKELSIKPSQATAVVQGFGNVGSYAALGLHQFGLKVIAVSDHTGALHDPTGLDIPALMRHAVIHGSIAGFSSQMQFDPAQILTLPCDVLVPAALERVIDAKVAENLKCRVLAEGANGPTTPDADLVLDKRRDEVFLIPDILCNSGGVVVSYFEWVQDLQQLFWEEEEVMRREYHILDRAFETMLLRAKTDNVSHRTAAMAIGVEKVRAAKTMRGLFPMITGLDHVVVLVSDIKVGTAAYQALFARTPSWQAGGDGVERVLFTLDNMTLELMAPSGDGATADRIRAVIADQGEGLASLCFRTNDIAKMHRRLDRLTLKPEPIADAESHDATTGATLSWKRTRAATDRTRGVRLFFLELAKERPLSVRTEPASITAMDHVVIGTADPEGAAALYGARLGLDMALDRSHPEWGRLMFFRCGDLVVEVAHKPGKDAPTAPDKLHGICWRVADIAATRARLAEAGLDMSEARPGRKPGTKVMTVRNGTCGVPTLLVERTPRPE